MDISSRCALMCGQEAEALGLPALVGYIMHDGIVEDDIEGWSDSVFAEWCQNIITRFGEDKQEALLCLYDACAEVMERYGNMIEEQIL